MIHTQNVICVVGMHRSGTSMVTHLLHHSGLHLGPPDRILGPHESNPKGHFENLDFIDVNADLLNHFGGSWDAPPLLEEGWEEDPSLGPILDKAETLLKAFAEEPVWGWKDPRTTLFLPFWKSLLPDMRLVVCIRNPIEVAKSLEARNGMDIQKGLSLWEHYMSEAMRHTEDSNRILVFYDDFFRRPDREISNILLFCGLDVKKSAGDIICRKSRHHRCTPINYPPEHPMEDPLDQYFALRSRVQMA